MTPDPAGIEALLERLEALRAIATPGPWTCSQPIAGRVRFVIADLVSWFIYPATNVISHGTTAEDDAKYIVALENAHEELAAALRSQSRALAEREETIGRLDGAVRRLRAVLCPARSEIAGYYRHDANLSDEEKRAFIARIDATLEATRAEALASAPKGEP